MSESLRIRGSVRSITTEALINEWKLKARINKPAYK